ncbi:MAG: rane protein of unknown function [Blastococcus sp.]|nr:rane protein of unknown function [Blastococcus sp.]
MFPEVFAWLAVVALCVAAVVFGRTARRPGPRRRRRSPSARLGLFVSLSGPWLVVVVAAGAGAFTGSWLPAAAFGAAGIVLASLVGLTLDPG